MGEQRPISVRTFGEDASSASPSHTVASTLFGANVVGFVALILGVIGLVVQGIALGPAWVCLACSALAACTPIVVAYLPRGVAVHWMPVVGLFGLACLIALDGGVESDALFFVAGVPAFSGFLLGRRSAVSYSIATCIVALFVSYFTADSFNATDWLRLVWVCGSCVFVAACVFAFESRTDQKSAELKDALRRLTALVVATPHDLYRLRRDGSIREMLVRRTAITEGANDDGNLRSYLPDEIADAIHELRSAALERHEVVGRVIPVGAAFFDVQISPLGKGQSLLLVQDVTASRDLETAKADFVSVVSHELRTPLTTVVASLGLLAAGVHGDLTPQVQRAIDLASRNAAQLRRLIDDLLDLRQIDSGEMNFDVAPLAPADVIGAAVTIHEPFANQHGVQITVSDNAATCQILGDPVRVQQVVSNLLSNAIKHAGAAKKVEVSASRGAATVRFNVRDFGHGIPAEFHERVFDRFSQAKRDSAGANGTGLGLAIAKQFVSGMNGRIGFDTELGVGTTFWFELPLAPTNKMRQVSLDQSTEPAESGTP